MAMAAAEIAEGDGTSDRDLVARVCAGDAGAFQLLYERYFPRVYRFVDKRLRNRADTEETVQEVFINLFSSIAGYRGEAEFAAWVFGLTRRTIASRFKRKRHATVPLYDEETDAIDPLVGTVRVEPTPHEAYECRERMARMQATARKELSDEQCQLVELHHLRNHSIQEIAATLSKSEDAVKSNLYRARKLLLAR
jgi:RNA polymerase sigma-70 factor (ECF subfamily)